MNTTTVSLKYRPVKIGFIIRKNNVEDLISAVGINTMLWGGIFNPIIPFEDELHTKEIGDNYRVDCYYAVSKNKDIEAFLKKQSFISPDLHDSEIFRGYDKKFAFVDVANLLDDKFIDEDPKFFTWNKSGYDLLQKILFGFYPERTDLDIDFKNAFLSRFNINPTVIDAKSKSFGIYHTSLTPIHLTSHKLNRYTNFIKHSLLLGSLNGFYIGKPKNFDDLVYFWNLRAYGYNLQFIPTSNWSLFEENTIDFLTKYKVLDSDDVLNHGLGIFYRRPNEKYSKDLNKLIVGKRIHHSLHETHLGIVLYSNPALFYCNHSNNNLAHITNIASNYQVSINLKNPPISESTKRDSSNQLYIASIDLEGEPFYKYTLHLPYLPKLNDFFRRTVLGRFSIDSLRIEANAVGAVITNQKNTLVFSPISFHSLIFEILNEAGLSPKIAQPGILTNKIINQLGHLDNCRVFQITGVRKLLKSLKVDETIVRSHITRMIHDDNGFKRFERLYIDKRDSPNLTTSQVVNFLLKNDFFRAGLTLICQSCFLENWIPVKRLDDYWHCEYCGHSNQLSIALNNRGDWKFRKSGMFGKDNNQEGAIPVILTLLLLYRAFYDTTKQRSIIYETAIKLNAPKNCEIDFCVINCRNREEFEIGFGECKDAGGNITEEDMANLKIVYNQLKSKRYSPYIILSKACNSFTPEEISLFKSAKEENYRIVIFTNKELEPYHLYFKEYKPDIPVPRPHPLSLEDLSYYPNIGQLHKCLN